MAIEHLQDEQLIHLQKYMHTRDEERLRKGADEAGIPLSEFLEQIVDMHLAMKQGRHEYFIEDPDERKIPPRSSGVFQRLKKALGI